MEKSFKQKLFDIKKEQGIGYVNFYNDGSVTTDENRAEKRIQNLKNSESIDLIKEVMINASESCARYCEFDSIKMNLIIGLVFKKGSLGKDNQILPTSEPLDNIVRFYTGSVNSFENGEQTNNIDYSYGFGRQSYLNYNEFVQAMKEEGISFIGPEDFETFKQLVLNHQVFEISIGVNFKEELTGPKLTMTK